MSEIIKLTSRFIDKYECGDKDITIWDAALAGFGIRFYPSGKRSFIVKKRIGSGRLAKQRKVTLGSYPTINLVVARRLAFEAIAKMQLGEDIVATKVKRIKAEADAKEAMITVAELAQRWLEEEAPRSRMRGARYGTLRSPKNIANDAGRIKRHINPLIGNIPVVELTTKMIERLRDDIAKGKTAMVKKTKKRGIAKVTGGEGTASKTVRILSTILGFGVRENIIVLNPAAGIRVTPSRQIQRFLTKDEQGRLERALQELEMLSTYEIGCTVIRLLMLTGCRKGEIEGLEWAEIDFERGFIAFSKSKTGAKIIPVSKAALDIIDNVPRLHSSKFVFASSRTDGHYVGTPKVWSKVRKEAKIEDVRLHDLRHNFASIAASNGLSLPIIGALLGHTQPSTTARYAHLTESSLQQAAEMISSNLQSYKK